MSKEQYSTPKAPNLANSQYKSSQVNSGNVQSNRSPIALLNNLTEVTIETYDKQIPYISLFKPDSKKQLSKTQSLILMNKLITDKKINIFRSSFNNFKNLKQYQTKINLIIYKISRVVNNLQRNYKKNTFYTLNAYKRYKLNGLVATKLIKNVFNRKYNNFLIGSMDKIHINSLIVQLQLSRNENKLVLQLNNQKKQIFKFKEGLYSIQFITKIKPLQKYQNYQSFLSELEKNQFQNGLKQEIAKFQDLRLKSNPKKKQHLDNQIVINVASCLFKALIDYTKMSQSQINELNNQLLSYKDVQGINQLKDLLNIKQSQISRLQLFVNQTVKLDSQLKRFSADSSQSLKVLSLLKTHITKMQPRAKKFQGLVLKIYTSRSFLYDLISLMIESLKKLSEQSNLILKRIVNQYKQPQQLSKVLKQSYNKTYYQQITQILINQLKTIKEYEINNGEFSRQNEELNKKINQTNVQVQKMKKQIIKLQTRNKQLQTQNGKVKEELQIKVKEIKSLKPLEKQIVKLQTEIKRLKQQINKLIEQHQNKQISYKEEVYQYKNKKFNLQEEIKQYQQNKQKTSQEIKWLRNKLRLYQSEGKSIIRQLPQLQNATSEENLQNQNEKKDRLEENFKKFQEQKQKNRKLQQKIIKYESLEEMLRFKIQTLETQRQRFLKAEQNWRSKQYEAQQIVHLEDTIKRLQRQRQMFEFKYKILQTDRERYIRAEQRIQYLQREKQQREKIFQQEKQTTIKQIQQLRHKLRIIISENKLSIIQNEDHINKSIKQNLDNQKEKNDKLGQKLKIMYHEKEYTTKLQEKIRKLQEQIEKSRIMQQKLIKYESSEQMLSFKIRTLQIQRQRFLKIQQKLTILQSESRQITHLQHKIKHLESQKEMFQFKYKVLQADKERYIKAEERIQYLEKQKQARIKLQEKLRDLISQKEIIQYKCSILQGDRDKLISAEQKIIILQKQRQIRIKAQQRIRQLQRQKDITKFKMDLISSSPFNTLSKRQQEQKMIQQRQKQRQKEKDRAYYLLQQKIRTLLEQKQRIERQYRHLQSKTMQQHSFLVQKQRYERTQQSLNLILNERIQQITQRSHKIQIELQLKTKEIILLTEQNAQKQKKIQQLYVKHLQTIDELSNCKVSFQKNNRELYKQINSLLSQSNSYKTIITNIEEDNSKKDIQIANLIQKMKILEQSGSKQRYLIQELKQKLRLSEQRYMQQKNRKVNEYLSQIHHLKKQYEYIVREYKLKMQRLQSAQLEIANYEKKYQNKQRVYNDLKNQNEHLKMKNLALRTEFDVMHHQKEALNQFIGQLQLKITEADDLSIHLKSQLTQVKSQFFKTSLQLQSYSTTRLYSDSRQIGIKRQLKQKQSVIQTILQQSKQLNDRLTKQLYQCKQQLQNNRRKYQLQLNQRHNSIVKLQFQLNSKESTIKSLQNLLILSDHLTQNTNKDSQMTCKNVEIQLLNKQIQSQQEFINQITAEYQSLEKKYHHERYQNKNFHLEFQTTSHKSQVTENRKQVVTDRDARFIKGDRDIKYAKETLSFSGSQGYSGQAFAQNLKLNFGQKYSEILEPVSKMNLSEDAEELLKKIILNNENLSDVMGQLRQQNAQLNQKLKNMYHKQWIIELMLNIIIHVLSLDHHSLRAEQISSDLNKIGTLGSQQFFIHLQQYCKTIIPMISNQNR